MRDHDPDRNALLRLFVEQSQGVLASMEEALAAIGKRPGDGEALRELLQVCHVLEAHARALGLADLVQITCEVEEVLGRLLAGTLAASGQVVDLLLASIDALREKLAEARG